MEELILEVGMKLEHNLAYYHHLLTQNGLKLDWSCITRDIYYTNKELDGLTENEMKNNCIRIRNSQPINDNTLKNKFDVHNFKIFDEYSDVKEISINELNNFEEKLACKGFKKVFDTIKFDFHYNNENMKSKVQLQEIKDIGLLVYYDNPDYYKYSEDKQRKALLEELNSYGFNFKESDLGLDKLRTLYYGKEMFSKNQNG